jgi:hypothetical protein
MLNKKLNTSISVGFVSSVWLSSLVISGNNYWDIINQINSIVRSDGYINTSPVATILPVIYKSSYTQHVHVVQMPDAIDQIELRFELINN